MTRVTHTEAALPWSQRVGGGYPTLEGCELAAQFTDLPVMIGKPHPVHGFFMVPHPAPPPSRPAPTTKRPSRKRRRSQTKETA